LLLLALTEFRGHFLIAEPLFFLSMEHFHSLANDDTLFYFTTNKDAPRDKVVKYDLTKPEEVRRHLLCARALQEYRQI